eukprot:132857_1
MFFKLLSRTVFITSVLITVIKGGDQQQNPPLAPQQNRVPLPKMIDVIRYLGATYVVGCICHEAVKHFYGYQIPEDEDRGSFTYAVSRHEPQYPGASQSCRLIADLMFGMGHVLYDNDIRFLGDYCSLGFCTTKIPKTPGNELVALAVNAGCRQPNIDLSGPSSKTGITLKHLRDPEWAFWTEWKWVTGIDLSGNQDIRSVRKIRRPNLRRLILNDIDSFEEDAFVSMAQELPNLIELQLRNCRNLNIIKLNLPKTLKILDLRGNAIRSDVLNKVIKRSKKRGFSFLYSEEQVIQMPDKARLLNINSEGKPVRS